MNPVTIEVRTRPGTTYNWDYVQKGGIWYRLVDGKEIKVTDNTELQAISNHTGQAVTLETQNNPQTSTNQGSVQAPTPTGPAIHKMIVVETGEEIFYYPDNNQRASQEDIDEGNITNEETIQLKNALRVWPDASTEVVNQELKEQLAQQGKLTQAELNYKNGVTGSVTVPGSQTSGGTSGGSTNIPGASLPSTDASQLLNSPIFQSLPEDQQEAVKSVYELIAANNTEKAQQLAAAFKASAELSDPFFKQELLLAVDAIERGFVSIDQEEAFRLEQLNNRRADLQEDIATRKDFLNLEEISALKAIDRQFDQQIKTTRQSLAASGFSSSSRRAEVEDLINETTGDLRESTTRKFGLQQLDADRELARGSRDIQNEVQRLAEVTKENKLDFLREAEAKVGTNNLPALNTNIDPLGSITGDIPRRQTEDIITGAQNLLF